MVNPLMDFFFKHGIALFVGLIPLALSLLLVMFTTSWRRWMAVALVTISGAILAFEIYSGSLEGNLTGLIWMLSSPFVAILILTLAILEWSQSRTHGSSGNERKSV
jgi:uncharacterized membrane protein